MKPFSSRGRPASRRSVLTRPKTIRHTRTATDLAAIRTSYDKRTNSCPEYPSSIRITRFGYRQLYNSFYWGRCSKVLVPGANLFPRPPPKGLYRIYPSFDREEPEGHHRSDRVPPR